MARLDPKGRAKLPDRAFAYIDSGGRRRLPIHDEAHVRNALARFNQVSFEDDAARELARQRLLRAAKKFRIVPVGFIAGQLRVERELGLERETSAPLPGGFVTMMMTDIEDSTALVHRLGPDYASLIAEVRDLLRKAVADAGGQVVEARADDFFAVFDCPQPALEAAIAIQHGLAARTWTGDEVVKMRIGIHAGYPTRTANNYIGLAVHAAARVCEAAHGGQVLVSGDTREAAQESRPDGIRFVALGLHRLRGLPDPVPLFQLAGQGLATRFPPPRATTPIAVE
jgi:class 3 adenylate cyclase